MERKIILIGVIILAFVLRFYRLGEIPPGLHRDEVSSGYNAYTILLTGRDEYGEFLPLAFQAFGDWKRPINIYLTSLIIPFFGLNELTVRLPIALIGGLSVVLVYLLAKIFFRKNSIALLSAFIFAISPWHIYMSRTGLGWNIVGLFFTLLGIYFFLTSGGRILFLTLSAIFWGLTLFSYASNQIFTPIFLLFLLTWRIITDQKKFSWKPSYLFPIFIFLTFFFVFLKVYTPVFSTNKVGSIFYTQHFVYENIEIPRSFYPHSLLSRLLHNRPMAITQQVVKNYLKILSPQFLFFNQEDNPAYSLKNLGNLYLFEFPFLVLGLFFLFAQERRFLPLILGWFLLSPLPASLTKNPYSSTRSLLLLPLFSFAIAYGIWWSWRVLRKKATKYGNLFVLGVIFLYLFNLFSFIEEYFFQFPINRAQHWGSAQKELVDFLKKRENNYREIIISRPQESFYIYLLYYNKYPPQKYWEEVIRYPKTVDGFIHVKSLGKYQFRDINYPEDLRVPGRLLVDKTLEMGTWATSSSYLVGGDTQGREHFIKTRVIKQIELPGKKPIFTILETYSEIEK